MSLWGRRSRPDAGPAAPPAAEPAAGLPAAEPSTPDRPPVEPAVDLGPRQRRQAERAARDAAGQIETRRLRHAFRRPARGRHSGGGLEAGGATAWGNRRTREAPEAPAATLGVTTRRFAPAPESAVPHVALDIGSVWRAAWVVVAVLLLASAAMFFFSDGAPVLFTAAMAFFASIALEPAVGRLARVMPRPLATAVVMLVLGAGIAGFFVSFGGLLASQVTQLVVNAPGLVTGGVNWVNEQFGTQVDQQALLSQVRLDTTNVTALATTLAGGVLGIVNSVASAAFTAFSFLFFTFYLSADAPRLRVWVAQLLPPSQQVVFLTLWQLTLTKIGGYVAARVVLALICSAVTGVFLYLIDMPYWLPLAIWTGVVAQFVPTVGTYLAISLPVLVGLLGDSPSKGLATFVFAVAYQQVENLTWEPRISARAVSVHPAVSFASAMLGAALFGVGGALVGVPVSATLIAVFDIYKQRYELSALAEQQAIAVVDGADTRT